MDNFEKEEILKKFPPEFRKLYEDSFKGLNRQVSGANKVRNHGHTYKATVAPLVKKIAPNTVVGRPAIPKNEVERVKLDNFIHPNDKPPINPGSVQNDKFIIDGYKSFHAIAKDNAEFKKEPEINSFVGLMNSIPGACGCVRGQLNESAANSYAHMLPLLHARNSPIFDIIKKTNNVGVVQFKEKDLILLTV